MTFSSNRRLLPAVGLALFLLAAGQAAGLTFDNQTLTGTVVLPAGSETHRFNRTITLSDATVEVEGYLRNEQHPVIVTGNGTVNIRGPEGLWTDGWVYSHLTIDPQVEVLGYFGSRFYAQGVNKGTLASVPGGDGGVYGNDFAIIVDQFTNEGLIEARTDSLLYLYLNDGLFQNTGEIRVQPGAALLLQTEAGHPLTAEALGTLHNDGTTRLGQFQVSGELNLTGAGRWEFDRGAELMGATLNIPATAAARVVSTSEPVFRMSGATVNGDLLSLSSADARIVGGLELNGEWLLGAGAVLFLEGEQTIGGIGRFSVASSTAILRSAGGATTIGPDVDLHVGPGTGLTLTYTPGLPAGDAYILEGDTLVDGGTLTASLQPITNRGAISATNGANLTFHSVVTNEGDITLDSGSRLTLRAPLENHGAASLTGGELYLHSALPQGPNPMSITDSTIYVEGLTLSGLEGLTRVRSEFVTTGTIYGGLINLEGGTLTIADQDNRRWGLGTGGMENGTIASEDGHELAVVGAGGAILRNLTLDADVRVAAGQLLQVNQGVRGAGSLIVDGGTLRFSGRGNQGAPMTSEVLAMVQPAPDATGSLIEIYGPMDNTGRTIHLKQGARWRLDVFRSSGITGGRIEGDPGVELEIAGGYPIGDLVGVTLATEARVVGGAYITQGLTLDGGVLTIGNPASGLPTSNRVEFQGQQTLGGHGEVRFDASLAPDGNTPFSGLHGITTSGHRLTIDGGITVRTTGGDGYIGDWFYSQATGSQLVAVPITNHGTLLAEQGHTLSLFTKQFEQHGVLRAEADSTLSLVDQSLTNSGRLEAAGGRITASGDLGLAEPSTLLVELSSGLAAAPDAALSVGGLLSLGGRLQATLAAGFAPAAGDTFTLASAGSVQNAFAQVQLPTLSDGFFWRLDATEPTPSTHGPCRSRCWRAP